MTSRRPLVSANWKMNLTHLDAIQWLQKLHYALPKDATTALDVSVHPPFTSLRSAQTVIDSDKMHVALGAQNAHTEVAGAFTGEVSAPMLAKLNVQYVIVGHSERRELMGETDEMVAAKVKAVFAAGLTPILCVGESLGERQEGTAVHKVTAQLGADLKGLKAEQVAKMVIAYEPIWAIGTGQTCSAEDAQEMCKEIRSAVKEMFTAAAADSVRIQYGGSAKVTNVAELMAQADIDGALVGGASLDAEEFARLVAQAAGA